MKTKLFLFLCLISLVSCYKADPLPSRMTLENEIAIPLIDTVVKLGDFIDIKESSIPPELLLIPKGQTISMGEIEFPFYLGDFNESKIIEWLEPKIVVQTGKATTGVVISTNIRLFTKSDYGTNNYFWLPEDYSLSIGSNPVSIPDTPTKITIDQIRYAQKVYLDLVVSFPEDIYASDILLYDIKAMFGIKFKIKGDVEVNL